MKQKTPEGDVDAMILKFAHIFEKKVYKKNIKLHDRIKTEKNLMIKASLIQSTYLLTAIEKSLLEAIEEFRNDAENAGVVWPRKRKKSL